MKKLLTLAAFLAAIVPARAQLTTVEQILHRANGSICSGSVTLSWNTFVSPDGNLNIQGSLVTLVPAAAPGTPGLLEVMLEPGPYTASYSLTPSGCGPTTEYWNVPVSATPVNLATVRTLNPPPPGVSVALANLSQSGATTNECVVWNGTIWHPGPCGSYGIGSALPATCTIGQTFFLTGTTPGQNWYGCTSTNVWTLESGGGGGGLPPYSTTTITTSPMSIPNSVHGQGKYAFGVCWTASTNPQVEQSCNWSRNPANGDLTLTYSVAPGQIDVFGSSTGGGGGGGPASFSQITAGSNTGNTLTVGNSSALTFTGSGVVNANQINTATLPASQGFVGTNGSQQITASPFTPLNPANNLSDVGSAATAFSNIAGFARTSVPTSCVNDTNVTCSIAANALSMGWSGQLAIARGGTGASTASGARTALGLGTAAVENVTAVIGDNGSGGLTILNGQVTSAMLAGTLNAATASALASTPSQCPAGPPQQFATGIAASGNANCAAITSSVISGVIGTSKGGTGTGSTFTQGSVVFAGPGGVYAQNNSNFLWDDTNKCLAIGPTGCSGNELAITAASADAGMSIVAPTSHQAFLSMNGPGGALEFGVQAVGDIFFFNSAFARNFLNVSGVSGDLFLQPQGGNVILGTNASSYEMDVQRSGVSGTARFLDQTPTTGITNVSFWDGAGQSANDLLDFYANSGSHLGGASEAGEFFVTDSTFTNFIAQLWQGVGIGLANNGHLDFSSTVNSFGTPDTGLYRSSAGVLEINNGTAGTYADLILRNSTASLGGKFECTHGSNATCGVVTLAAGTATVSTTAIAALAAAGSSGDAIRLTLQTCSSCGTLSVGTVMAGTSFVINSSNGADASDVYWEIHHIN